MKIKPLYEFDDDHRQEIIRMHLGSSPRGGRVTGPIEGKYGSVYSIDVMPTLRIAAKCPCIKRFEIAVEARSAIEKALHELEKTYQVFMVPWVNRFFDVQFIHGWPFLLSRYHDGTLQDLISNPLAWTSSDRIVSLILISRALHLASKRGIAAHQDLKPENIFFDDLSRIRGVPKNSYGMHFHIFVGDLGLANAFLDFGQNQGSRPYMAPEQYGREVADPTVSPAFDVFALSVIACECFLDGKHPSGIITRDCWPWRKDMPQKWNREKPWRTWSESKDKTLPKPADHFPPGVHDLLLDSLAVDPSKRPSLCTFEEILWQALKATDQKTADGLRTNVAHIEGLTSPNVDWPHMDHQVKQLRNFYSSN
jgi:serine/threonine protein kinase